ncbi:fibronectin type III domain-containing protein [Ihubacter sp. mB4P-1]|uniref:fibronectin type III domain-containing protein n=1 Tax=Ihubacter sp. mB4P-1 TaxID=3242370 RepID=UPI00137A2EA6
MKKRILTLFLICFTVFCTLPLSAEAAFAEEDMTYFTGRDCTSNKTAAATIDFVMNKYKSMSKYPGSGQCWGYAEKISSMLAASRETKYYTGLRLTEKNFKNKCLNAKAGTHIRLNREKKFNAWKGHSVVLLKVTEEQVVWADNNYAGENTVAYYSGTIEDFLWNYGQYGYINMVAKPIKYRTYSEPQVSSGADEKKGGVRLTWLKLSGCSQYEVYRSYSKSGSYKRIAKVADTNFTDNAGRLGEKAYYKVKAVKRSGSKYSNVTSRISKLMIPWPEISNDAVTGQVVLNWKPVPKADRYIIYRMDLDTGEYKKIETTTECSFTDTDSNDQDAYYFYRMKAVCDTNSKGNSPYVYMGWCRNEPLY